MINRVLILTFVPLAFLGAMLPVPAAETTTFRERWNLRFDMGGVIPEEATLTELGGPVSGQTLKLDPGFQFDLAAGYRVTPWLEVGPEVGFTFNGIDSVGDWSYPGSLLWQIPMMANMRLEYPNRTRLTPFVGAGVGGVASMLSFGGGRQNTYNHYAEPDGAGSDISLGFQLFGGLSYRVGDNFNLGLQYRYLATDRQHWDVRWWNGSQFGISADSIKMHSVCLVFSGHL